MNIYESIMNIDAAIDASQDCVMESLLAAYDKSLKILEYYDGPELDCFSIFQEGSIMDDVKKRGEGQNALVKIITFIPRLIGAIISFLKNKFSKKNGPIEAVIEEVKELPKDKNKQKNLAVFASLGAAAAATAVAGYSNHKTKEEMEKLKSAYDDAMRIMSYDKSVMKKIYDKNVAYSHKQQDVIKAYNSLYTLNVILNIIQRDLDKNANNLGTESIESYNDLCKMRSDINDDFANVESILKDNGINPAEYEPTHDTAVIWKGNEPGPSDEKIILIKDAIFDIYTKCQRIKNTLDSRYKVAVENYDRMQQKFKENCETKLFNNNNDFAEDIKVKTRLGVILDKLADFNKIMDDAIKSGKILDPKEYSQYFDYRYDDHVFMGLTNDKGTGVLDIITNDSSKLYRALNDATYKHKQFEAKYKKELKEWNSALENDTEIGSKEIKNIGDMFQYFVDGYKYIYRQLQEEYLNLQSLAPVIDFVMGGNRGQRLSDAIDTSREGLKANVDINRAKRESEF